MDTIQFMKKYDIPNVQIAYFFHPTTGRKVPMNEKSSRSLLEVQAEMTKPLWALSCHKYNPITKRQFSNAEIELYKIQHGLVHARSLKPSHSGMCVIDIDMDNIY